MIEQTGAELGQAQLQLGIRSIWVGLILTRLCKAFYNFIVNYILTKSFLHFLSLNTTKQSIWILIKQKQ